MSTLKADLSVKGSGDQILQLSQKLIALLESPELQALDVDSTVDIRISDEESPQPGSVDSEKLRALPISELGLGVRSYNCLARIGVETIGDLASKTQIELLTIPNFWHRSLQEVIEAMKNLGFELPEH